MLTLLLIQVILLQIFVFVGAFRRQLIPTTRRNFNSRTHDNLTFDTSGKVPLTSTATRELGDTPASPVLVFPGGGIFFWVSLAVLAVLPCTSREKLHLLP